jgi:hypothetical protein
MLETLSLVVGAADAREEDGQKEADKTSVRADQEMAEQSDEA